MVRVRCWSRCSSSPKSRQELIADNIANVSTPGYRQKDLSTAKFQQMLRERVDRQQTAPPGSVRFDDISADLENPRTGILFHDGNNRSMEYLMTENAKNAAHAQHGRGTIATAVSDDGNGRLK